MLDEHREELDLTSEILLRRETIEREQFIELLDGKSEEEVFGAEEPPVPVPPPPTPEAPERKPERAPKTLPRPGLAGGTAEMRGDPAREALAWCAWRAAPCRIAFRRPVARFAAPSLASRGSL